MSFISFIIGGLFWAIWKFLDSGVDTLPVRAYRLARGVYEEILLASEMLESPNETGRALF